MPRNDSKTRGEMEMLEQWTLMNTREVATFLRCSTQQIARLRKRGFPTIKMGEMVRFSKDEVMDWMTFQHRALNLGG